MPRESCHRSVRADVIESHCVHLSDDSVAQSRLHPFIMSQELYLLMLRNQIRCTVLNFTLAGIQTALSALAIQHLRAVEHLPKRTYFWSCTFIVALWLSFAIQMVGSLPVTLAVYRMHFDAKFWDRMFANLMATMASLAVLADSLLAFRCWVIWERPRIFIIAVILIVVKFGIMVATVVLFVTHWMAVHFAAAQRMTDVSIALSLTFNVLLAVAAIARLLQLRSGLRRATQASGNHYLPVVRLITANAVLWTIGCVLGIIFKFNTSVAPVLSSFNAFFLAASPLFLFLHIGRRRPVVYGDVVSADLAPSFPNRSFRDRFRLSRTARDLIAIDEALMIPGSRALPIRDAHSGGGSQPHDTEHNFTTVPTESSMELRQYIEA